MYKSFSFFIGIVICSLLLIGCTNKSDTGTSNRDNDKYEARKKEYTNDTENKDPKKLLTNKKSPSIIKREDITALRNKYNVDRVAIKYNEVNTPLINSPNNIPVSIPKILYNVCPNENCYYPSFYSLCRIPVYVTDELNSEISFYIEIGDKFKVETGNCHIKPGIAIINESFSYNRIEFNEGQYIYILLPKGEGNYLVWYNDLQTILPIDDVNIEVSDWPDNTFWIKIKNNNDKYGWIIDDNIESRGRIPG